MQSGGWEAATMLAGGLFPALNPKVGLQEYVEG